MKSSSHVSSTVQHADSKSRGAIGWVLLWAVGIPVPILLVLFLLRGCT